MPSVMVHVPPRNASVRQGFGKQRMNAPAFVTSSRRDGLPQTWHPSIRDGTLTVEGRARAGSVVYDILFSRSLRRHGHRGSVSPPCESGPDAFGANVRHQEGE